MKVEHIDPQNHEETTILVEGLARDTTLMHITDSHFAEGDERDPEAGEAVEKYQELFQQRTPGGVPATQVFREALARSNEIEADCTVLTGDIIHFPSLAGLDAIEAGVKSLDAPYLYTLGNHDWFFPYLEWNDEIRQAYYPRFHRLTGGDPACQVEEINGLLLVALDNSNYQVSQVQVDFLQEQLQTGLPCLLFMHIPLCTPALMPAVMEFWEAPIVMAAQEGWTEESRARWKVRKNDESTQACYELLNSEAAQNLAGIFSGHVHFPHGSAMGEGCFQYVTRPGFEGGYRVIRLKPRSYTLFEK